jgi:DNA-binding MarR family transcriptional regulator
LIGATIGSMDITADAAGLPEPPEIPRDPLALERQVCFALSVATRSVLSVYRPILEPMGLTHPQYLVMLALWGQSPLAVKELIEMLQLDGPTLSPLLKRLEAAGLVTRTRDPDDERQLRIDLTQKGRALREDALNVPPSVVAKLGMSLGDLEELHKGLTTLNEAARRAGVKPLPAPGKDGV